jgi:16S rRNA (guanine527-N7)-methyltransferase
VTEPERLLLHDWSTKAFGVDVDVGVAARIERHLDLLETWNRRLRLTGERDRRTLIRKHVADALACVPWLPAAGSFLDIGTGAGLPGVVLACVRPDLAAVLLDSRQRPASFLNEVVRTVPLLKARVVVMRAEDAAADPTLAGGQHVVVSRATRMEDVLRLAKPLLVEGGCAISMQTPKTLKQTAESIARRYGYTSVELLDYRLPGGEPRRLVVAR